MDRILHLLQLNGGTFPSGAFSQSYGLETYVTDGRVHDEATFTEFLKTYVETGFSRSEGPVIREAYRLADHLSEGEGDAAPWEELQRLEDLSRAVKMTRESREAGMRTGKAVLRILTAVLPNEKMATLREHVGDEISYPVIYGLAARWLDLREEEMLEGYVFGMINTLVQSAVKLIPLGNTQAQRILYEFGGEMEGAVDMAMKTGIGEISNFCPMLDLAGMEHENLPVRLYMS